MNDNKSELTILFGLEYQKSFISKPQFFDLTGDIRIENVLNDMVAEYRHLKDDNLIQELFILKKQKDDVLRNGNESLFVDLQIKRQMLTNAYALNHGSSLGDIKRISVINKDYLEKQAFVFTIILAIESLFIKYPTAFSSIDKGLQSLIIQNSSLNYLDPKTKAKLERILCNLYSMRSHSSLVQWTRVLYNQNLHPYISFYLSEVFIQKFGKDKFQGFVDEADSSYKYLLYLMNKFQIPPYGVALAMDYEDDGQRILPWHGKLSEQTISELRRIMHAEVHDRAYGSQNKAYNAIVAAYCNRCFNTEPNLAMVQQEFITTPHNKGSYSVHATRIMKKYKPFVERGYTTSIDDLVTNEPFYSQYIKMREILKST